MTDWKPGEPAIVKEASSSLDGKTVFIHRESVMYPGSWHCFGSLECSGKYLLKAHQLRRPDDPHVIPSVQTTGIEEASAIDGWLKAMTRTFGAQPALEDISVGATRWQQAEPSRRRVNFQIQGHLVVVWATTLEGPRTSKLTFFTPDSAEVVHRTIDEAFGITNPRASVSVANEPAMKFTEDSGEID